MKRFYKHAAVTASDGGHGVELDGRPVRTPARNLLAVPGRALAEAIAAEWNAQGDKIDPRMMPLTGLANAAIDRIATDQPAFAKSLAVYGESDCLAYRADGPAALVARQQAAWDPILDWARQRYDVRIETTAGLMHKPQPPETLERLGAAVEAMDAFRLAALSPLVTISGSLVIALALAEGAIDIDTAWAAGHLDELWQVEQWGEDSLAAEARATRRRDFEAGARFLELVSQPS